MFTGIVEEIGKVKNIFKGANSFKITIECNKVLKELNIGDSICTNGICLTVTYFDSSNFVCDVMHETISKSSLGELKIGSRVNLERALKISDRLGGHIVSGHIDGVGIIKELKKDDNAIWVSVKASKDILKYVVCKGSICIDGISLTVAYIDNSIFKVSLIPHTFNNTIFMSKKVNDKVNLECDVLGKYVEKLFGNVKNNSEENNKSYIDKDFLIENGF